MHKWVDPPKDMEAVFIEFCIYENIFYIFWHFKLDFNRILRFYFDETLKINKLTE